VLFFGQLTLQLGLEICISILNSPETDIISILGARLTVRSAAYIVLGKISSRGSEWFVKLIRGLGDSFFRERSDVD